MEFELALLVEIFRAWYWAIVLCLMPSNFMLTNSIALLRYFEQSYSSPCIWQQHARL